MKTLSERIAERVRDNAACASHSNRAIVLALRKDIQQAFDDGWSVLAVYQTLYDEGRLTFSYQAFRRHVNRILLDKAEPKKRPAAKPREATGPAPAQPIQNFTFSSRVNKEELIC